MFSLIFVYIVYIVYIFGDCCRYLFIVIVFSLTLKCLNFISIETSFFYVGKKIMNTSRYYQFHTTLAHFPHI